MKKCLRLPSSFGKWAVVLSPDQKLQEIRFPQKPPRRFEFAIDGGVKPELRELASRLRRYFRGGKSPKLHPQVRSRGTPFQEQVWTEICRIPFGSTRSYGEIARRLRRPRAARAVGAACGANPLPILVPCHRVVAGHGGIGGFSGGLAWKKWLLKFEALEGKKNPHEAGRRQNRRSVRRTAR